jgi:hypothetical protein
VSLPYHLDDVLGHARTEAKIDAVYWDSGHTRLSAPIGALAYRRDVLGGDAAAPHANYIKAVGIASMARAIGISPDELEVVMGRWEGEYDEVFLLAIERLADAEMGRLMHSELRARRAS